MSSFPAPNLRDRAPVRMQSRQECWMRTARPTTVCLVLGRTLHPPPFGAPSALPLCASASAFGLPRTMVADIGLLDFSSPQPNRENNFTVQDDPGNQVFPRAGAYSMAGRMDAPEKLFISNMHNAVNTCTALLACLPAIAIRTATHMYHPVPHSRRLHSDLPRVGVTRASVQLQGRDHQKGAHCHLQHIGPVSGEISTLHLQGSLQ